MLHPDTISSSVLEHDQLTAPTVYMRINYGGVVLFYHCSLYARRVTFIDYSTFESVSAYVMGSALKILVIVMHQPGSAFVSDQFFDEFSDLLERASTYALSLTTF